MNQFYQNTSHHFKPLLFNNEMACLQYDALTSFLQNNISKEYHNLLAKPFVNNNNINWYTNINGKFSPLDFFSKAERNNALIKYHQFKEEIKKLSDTLIESNNIEKITWANMLIQVFDINNNIVFSNGNEIVLLWGWTFNSAEENYIPPSLYIISETKEQDGQIDETAPLVNNEASEISKNKNENLVNSQNIENKGPINKKIIVRSNKKSLGFLYYLKKMWWAPILLLFILTLFYFIKPIDCCNLNYDDYPFLNHKPSKFPTDRPKIDTSKIIKDTVGGGFVIANLVNIALKEKDKSFEQFAIDLKKAYPDSAYKIVYYDTTISRLQFTFPENLRSTIKEDIKTKLNSYQLLIWDESVFNTNKVFNDPAFSNNRARWYFNAVNASQAWDITTGTENVVVAIIDCGFDLNHPDLRKKIVHPYNVVTKDSVVFASSTLFHGTHVAGIALANSNNGVGASGIAPGCSFMPIQISGNDGVFTSSDVIDGLLFAIKHNANVINMSLGKVIPDQVTHLPVNQQQSIIDNTLKDEEYFWKEIFTYAEKQNVTIVIASGNDNAVVGLDPMQRSPEVIKVSSVDSSFNKAPYSNFGQLTTICAPGTSIYNCFPNNNYSYLDGTSMASPVVAGAVALMKSVNPGLKNKEIIEILKSTGRPINNNNIGSLIQIDKAVNAAKTYRSR
jgi:hypothetical protein